jgi:predicted deacetylase
MSSPRRLLASIHDVAPGFEEPVDRLVELLERRLGGSRFAMLVVPEHWAGSPLRASPAFQRQLRKWADSGIEMFVHGWFHQDRSAHRGVARFKARHMTASEGEFLGLDEAEALRRMVEGKALIEDAIGRPAAGFVAPAWLYGPGALAALAHSGMPLAEDHWRVWETGSQRVLVRGPVITWASRSSARAASSCAFAALARVALTRLPTVRIAVHPGDVTREDILASIDKTLTRFVCTHQPSGYADIRG